MEQIGKSYQVILDAYHTLGEKRLLEIGFKDSDLIKAIAEKKAGERARSNGVVTAVHNAFSENTWYGSRQISDKLTKIYNDFFAYNRQAGMSPKIKLYFNAHIQNKSDIRGWMLHEKIN